MSRRIEANGRPAVFVNGQWVPVVSCCDLHNNNCEPPSELCCWECPERLGTMAEALEGFRVKLGRLWQAVLDSSMAWLVDVLLWRGEAYHSGTENGKVPPLPPQPEWQFDRRPPIGK